MKKLLFFFLCGVLVFSLSACNENKNQTANDVVCTVGNEEITEKEIEYFTSKSRASVMSKFISEYSADVDENFWNTEFGGITPQEYLDEVVKEQSVMAKIQLVLCREKGIYDDISFDGLYELAVEYNKAHENSNSVGIYSISLDTFYDYYLDNGIMELKNILGENELKPDEKEINVELENAKEKYPHNSEEEQLSFAKDIIIEKKYDEYIKMLYNETVIKNEK